MGVFSCFHGVWKETGGMKWALNTEVSKYNIKTICDALRDFRPFLQYKKREKHPWRSVTFKSNTPLWVFYMFFELNVTKSRNGPHFFVAIEPQFFASFLV